MGCNCNQSTNYNLCNPAPCQEPQDCSCPTILKSDCVTYSGNDLECSGIVTGQTLTETVEQLDTFICEKVDDITNALTLKNIGDGAKVYKGDDLLGRKELRTVTKTGNLVTVTENPDDIAVSIDEEALNTFIEANQKTYSVDNVGVAPLRVNVYKDSTVVGNNTQFNFRSVVTENLGTGKSFLRDIQQNTDELNVRVKTLVSDNLTITATDEEVRIETPSTASIPALYVNNLYIPTEAEFLAGNTKGEGTLAKPFTDTVTAYVAGVPTITDNTAIQNALDAYVGDTGTYSRLNPEKTGQQITVQDNTIGYIFPGDFNYENINIKLEASVTATTTDYLVDMDNPLYFNAMNGRFLITIEADKILELVNCLGFRNSGNTSTTPPMYDSGRMGVIYGEGTLFSSYAGSDILTRYLFTGEGYNNDNNLHFQIRCKIKADQQGIYFTKNLMRIDFYNQLLSGVLLGSGDINLKALHMTGGQIRFYEKGSIYLGNEVIGRTYGVTFEPQDDGIGYTRFQLNSGKVAGSAEWFFVKLNNEHVDFTAFNSPSGDGFATVIPGSSTVVPGLFENLGVNKWSVDFKNNVFSYTGIDFTKVDLTGGNAYSAINFIGNSVVESLVTFDDRAAAIDAGIPLYSAYLKTSGVAYPTTTGWIRDIVLPM